MYSSVTHIFSQRDCDAIASHIEYTAAQYFSPPWSAGWHGEIEAALLDAAFSARAPYGRPDTGVRRVVGRWRNYRQTTELDDLQQLASFENRSSELAEILGNRQRVAGNSTTKAEAVIAAASALKAVGVRHAEDLHESEDQRRAFTGVRGVGTKTWECVLFLVGVRTPDALGQFSAFVSEAVGRDVDAEAARSLLEMTAHNKGLGPAGLEHAVWRHQRRSGPTPSRSSLSRTG